MKTIPPKTVILIEWVKWCKFRQSKFTHINAYEGCRIMEKLGLLDNNEQTELYKDIFYEFEDIILNSPYENN